MAAVRADTCVRRAAGGEGASRRGRWASHRLHRPGATFAYDYHGDGRLALTTKTPAGEQEVLVAAEPERFFVPPYLGHRGWVGPWLDTETPDWDEIREMLVESYCLCAPRSLAKGVSG